MARLQSIPARRDFLRARHQGEKALSRGLVIQATRRNRDDWRVGLTASKKIGNAVVRNLAKRKIREVFRHIKDRIEPAMDIVIVSGGNLVSLPVSVIERKVFQSLPIKR